METLYWAIGLSVGAMIAGMGLAAWVGRGPGGSVGDIPEIIIPDIAEGLMITTERQINTKLDRLRGDLETEIAERERLAECIADQDSLIGQINKSIEAFTAALTTLKA